MSNEQDLAVLNDLWPPKKKRCKVGTRKRVCKVNGENVIDCFNPCSVPSASQYDQMKIALKNKNAELELLKKRSNKTIQKMNHDRTEFIRILRENDARIDSFKQKEHVMNNQIKRANRTIKHFEKQRRNYQDVNDKSIKLHQRVKTLASDLNTSELNIHNLMSMNEALQKQNENLLEISKRKDFEAKRCSEELTKCRKKLEDAFKNVHSEDSDFGQDSEDESETESGVTTAAAAAAAKKKELAKKRAAAALLRKKFGKK